MAFDDDIDPSIAALLADTQDEIPEVELNVPKKDGISSFGGPQNKDFENFVAEKSSGKPKRNGCVPEVDLNIKSFAPIEKYFEDTPSKCYDDPSYYKKCLTGEGASSQRLHSLLVKYLNCQDKKDRTVYRQQIITAYWEFLRNLAPKMARDRKSVV